MIIRAWSKYRESNSRTASGSRDSDSGVNPTRSQNSTEHTRRSATGRLAAADAAGAPPSAVPHSLQNLPLTGLAPHAGQAVARLAPHSLQNLPLTGLAPHAEHVASTFTPGLRPVGRPVKYARSRA